ncbi:hypothetical protein SAMN05216464_11586 [Mucilaginibacter pineti]|uniref:Type IV pili methyl-accepting chemotaxis transducer N-term n=1 Tax=Mucilaginibacter pineti TaxID=1391627 RepID=A0A1G7JQV7_9SPHI|nr:hypothetical protein [Mucilaginibacter pineti]SDF27330.1 hypothetical protein SAMN05216464_11586 [Mucilaginibacter pineti]
MRKLLVLIFPLALYLSPSFGQQSTIDVVGMHQLIDQSKAENKLQVQARNQQAAATANEQANLTLLAKLKNTYRTLQQRYNTLGTAINIANIGIYATPMVDQIIRNQAQIVQLTAKNPAIVVLGLRSQIEFVDKAQSLLGYVTGLTLSLGDVNQLKASDRKLLFDYVISELSSIQELSANMLNLLQYNNLAAVIRALDPFQNFISQDKAMIDNILSNAKYLKQ